MRRLLATLLVGLGFVPALLARSGPGPLVVVGGGATPPAVVARMLALAGGPRAVVVVLPQASAVEHAGDDSVALFRAAGAAEVVNLDPTRTDAVAVVSRATLVWFPGGDQNRLMKMLAATPVLDAVRARHAAGAVVGGSSAGAAVMSRVMITGEADLTGIAAGATVTAEGLGVWPEVIVDQHFLKRQRANRLIAAVLDHPDLVGVGIDEKTAVIVTGSRFEVMGDGSVIVIDARHADVPKVPAGAVASGRDLSLHVLTAGTSFDLGDGRTSG